MTTFLSQSKSNNSALTRRRFLRGSGVALATPFFASLASATDKPDPTPPLRTAFLYFPNGVWEKAWVPTKTGKDFELPDSLSPLKDIRSEVTVLSGLDKKHSRKGDGHYAKTANFLTGMPVAKTTGKNISSGGISVDQLIAKHIGDKTPIPSLELGTEPVVSGIDSNVGYTRLYGSYISWMSANRPAAKEINPRAVYQRLFDDELTSKKDAQTVRNLLDYVLEDARDVRRTLGRDDQFKMDEYLDSLRAVEKRINFSRQHQRKSWQPTLDEKLAQGIDAEIPEHFGDHIEIMLDLMVLAFQADATRVSTFMFANDVSGRNFSFLDGVNSGHHEVSHHQNKQEKIKQYQLINRWHVEQLARMLEKMRSVREGDGTLLDNSMIMFGSSFSDGNRHDPDNLPILLAGRGGNTIQAGHHIAADGEVPICNLYLTLLRKNGIDLKSFGDSTTELALS